MVGCDTSFLISVFLHDRHHRRARALLVGVEEPVFLSRLNLLEFQTSIRRMIGSSLLDEGRGLRAIGEFEAMVRAGNFEVAIPPEVSIWERALQLSRGYSSELLVRSLDIWQVAFALEMKARTFWTFDDRQRKLAIAVGLEVNP